MDEECKHRDSISEGMTVLIALHKTAPSSEWISAKVEKIIDHQLYNEDGILVQISEFGISGNVKKIIEKVNLEDELTNEQILQTLKQIQKGTGFETTKFELKETYWYDVNKSEKAGKAIKNLNLEYEVVEDICALLNTSGGHLLIGVTDDGIIKGITEKRDLQWMSEGRKDLDHFADKISQDLENKYFADKLTSKFVFVKPRVIEEKLIIVIKIKKSWKPFFVHKKGVFTDKNQINNTEDLIHFFIRRETGATYIPINEIMTEWINEK